jgi:hypothetical protein
MTNQVPVSDTVSGGWRMCDETVTLRLIMRLRPDASQVRARHVLVSDTGPWLQSPRRETRGLFKLRLT